MAPPGSPPRWSLRRNILGGITHRQWRRLRADNTIDDAYRSRALMLGLVSRLNSAGAGWERRRFGGRLAEAPLPESPLFILGSWRSGTTYLHHLLAQDPRFGAVTTLDAIFPEHSLVLRSLMGKGSVRKRPMDNVEYGPFTPNEDEFAIAVRSRCSPFLGYAFPRRSAFYDRYLTLADATPDELSAWNEALRATLRKAAFVSGRRELLLKSPPHTGRVRHLLALFPRARFVLVHRHPHAIFQSLLALDTSIGGDSWLQVPSAEDLTQAALRRYGLMFEAYFADRGLLAPEQVVEVGFDQLQADGMGVVERIYAQLGLPALDEVQPRLASYVQGKRDYRRNVHAALPPELADRIRPVAERSMAEWGYRP